MKWNKTSQDDEEEKRLGDKEGFVQFIFNLQQVT
jgi:hypothetical protein